jgi:tetratricopeptide (TPR) repeat protein
MQPNDPDAQVSLGNALLGNQQVDEAVVHYQKAMAIRPDYFLARYALGRATLEKGELDAAIQHFRAALLIRPDDPDSHAVLALTLEEKGQLREAIKHYEKAVEIAPQSVPALTNLAWLLATCADGSYRNGGKALELARQADQLSRGTNALVLRSLAAAYAENSEFEKAIGTARTAMQLARMQGNNSLVMDLEQQSALYRLGVPYRETAK